jgi:hypothetical protein
MVDELDQALSRLRSVVLSRARSYSETPQAGISSPSAGPTAALARSETLQAVISPKSVGPAEDPPRALAGSNPGTTIRSTIKLEEGEPPQLQCVMIGVDAEPVISQPRGNWIAKTFARLWPFRRAPSDAQ